MEEDEKPLIPTDENCFLLNDQGDTIIDYKAEFEECSLDVIIPSNINNTTITTIGDMAFMNDQPMVPMTSVTNIGGVTFENNQLTSVSVPSHLTFNNSNNRTFPPSANIVRR